MVAVQMRDIDRVNGARIQSFAVHADQRTCPAVDEKCVFLGAHMKTRLEPAAGAEGVTAADHGQLHVFIPPCSGRANSAAPLPAIWTGPALALGRLDTSARQRARFVNVSGTSMRPNLGEVDANQGGDIRHAITISGYEGMVGQLRIQHFEAGQDSRAIGFGPRGDLR